MSLILSNPCILVFQGEDIVIVETVSEPEIVPLLRKALKLP